MPTQSDYTAKTLFGLEALLAYELQTLGATRIRTGHRSVQFHADLATLYRANLAARTAIRILKPLFTFHAKNERELYDGIRTYDWPALFDISQTLAIDATLASDYFTHSQYVALKTKDAIVDQFRDRFGKRPSVNPASPDIRIQVHIHDTEGTVSLDSSGVSLHQRGYRQETGIAPLNEVLAAGCLLLSGWNGQVDFLDPMCGSGTLLIEAARIACHMAPGLQRSEFAFERWPDYDNALFEAEVLALEQQIRKPSIRLRGMDMDQSVLDKAAANIKRAGMADYITLEQGDFFESDAGDKPLHLVFNPPYDERISIRMPSFYQSLGATLKHHYQGSQAWILTANLEAIQHIGLKPFRKIKLYNGPLEARLLGFDLFSGKRNERRENT